jgi:peptide/nickel transport system permease protein
MTRTLGRFVVRQPLGAAGAVIVVVMILLAVLAPVLAPHGPKETGFAPYVAPGAEFPMGTDQVGRDVLSRVIWGARLSLQVGPFSVVFGITLGSLWGVTTAYFGGAWDAGPAGGGQPDGAPAHHPRASSWPRWGGHPNVILALTILLTPTAARGAIGGPGVVAAPYVEAARAAGCSHTRIIARHLIPNCLASYIVLFTTNVSYAIVVGLALLHRGGGAADEPSWGGMLTAGSGAGDGAVDGILLRAWPSVWPCSRSTCSATRSVTSPTAAAGGLG